MDPPFSPAAMVDVDVSGDDFHRSPCHAAAPVQHSKLHNLVSHTGSGCVNYVRPPAAQLSHNLACFCCSIGFGANAAKQIPSTHFKLF